VAEEALSMGLYCALGAKDFEDGIILAVNHSGDSDSNRLDHRQPSRRRCRSWGIPDRWFAHWNTLHYRSPGRRSCRIPEWRLRTQADAEERDFYTSRYPVGCPVGVRRLAVAFLPPST